MATARGNGAMEFALTSHEWLTVTSMADFLEQKKQEIAARLKELKPAVDEYHRLEGALQALDGVGAAAPAPAAPARGRRGRRPGTGTGTGTRTGRRGRPRGTGTRAAQ